MPRLPLFILLTLWATFSIAPVAADDLNTPLPDAQVTGKALKGLFDAAFLKADYDEQSGYVRVLNDAGMKTFVAVDQDKKLISFATFWPLKQSVSQEAKLGFVNRLNTELIFVRFSVTNQGSMACQSQVIYENGISAYTIVRNFKLHDQVVWGAVNTKDPEGYIGQD